MCIRDSYCTQAGLPKIILLGDLKIQDPLMFATWSNRFMLKGSDSSEELLDVYFKTDDNRGTLTETISQKLPAFIYFLAHKPIPESPTLGLNLSYSRTIGVLHSLWREEHLLGMNDKVVDFKAQQDRLLATIERLTSHTVIETRKNFDCLLYTSPSPRDGLLSRMPSSA